MAKFLNKIALITGASSGIGKGTAVELASQGCRLVISGRNAKALNESRALCLTAAKGLLNEEHVLPVLADIGVDADRERLIKETISHFGQLDILVNNAGIIARGTLENTSMEDYDNVMNVNTRAVFHLTKLAIPHLKKSKGNVVNVSSVNGLRSFAGVIAYNMSKAALDQLTRCAALELAADGVRVNSVNPGVVETNIHRRGGLNEEEYQKFLEHSKSTHALGRAGEVSEVAKSIVFLASPDASFITGVTLSVDGGRAQMCPR